MDLRHDFVITGIATQGFEALSDFYVINYNFSHSRDGHTWNIFPVIINLSFCGINKINIGNDNIYSYILYNDNIIFPVCPPVFVHMISELLCGLLNFLGIAHGL